MRGVSTKGPLTLINPKKYWIYLFKHDASSNFFGAFQDSYGRKTDNGLTNVARNLAKFTQMSYAPVLQYS